MGGSILQCLSHIVFMHESNDNFFFFLCVCDHGQLCEMHVHVYCSFLKKSSYTKLRFGYKFGVISSSVVTGYVARVADQLCYTNDISNYNNVSGWTES